jgi:nitrogen fixation protein FixH
MSQLVYWVPDNMMMEAASRRFWVSFVLMFFVIDIAIAVTAIVMAIGDASFKSIPGFGERSVHWDEQQIQQAALEKLGWSIKCQDRESSSNKIVVRIEDQADKSIEVEHLRITLFHYTRVSEQQTTIGVWNQGRYEADVDLSKFGLWHIEYEGITKDGTQFWTQQTLDWIP